MICIMVLGDISLTTRSTGSVHRELVRYEAIPLPFVLPGGFEACLGTEGHRDNGLIADQTQFH